MDNSSQDPQHLTQQIAASYVDDYMPPVSQVVAQPPAQPAVQPPITAMPPMPPTLPPMVEEPASLPMTMPVVPLQKIPENPDPMADFASTPDAAPIAAEPDISPVSEPASEPAVEADMKPVAEAPKSELKEEFKEELTEEPKSESKEVSEALEDQNIFEMLGISAATDAEKETFLDELQQIIWEDFLDNDVELLLTDEELGEFKKISEKTGLSEDDKQTEMVDFLEKLIPDLEKIMLEKAIELKEEMFTERLVQLRKEFAEKPEALNKLDEAQKLQQDQKWRQAAQVVNAIAQ